MKKTRFIPAMLLILAMLLAMVGCGTTAPTAETKDDKADAPAKTEEKAETASDAGEEETSDDELPFLTLRALFVGDDPGDGELVYMDKLKELTTRDGLNCNMDIDYISWGDYPDSYLLQLASGEPYDIIYFNNSMIDECRNGAFREITMDEIEQYMPETYAAMPQEGWDITAVDGKIYYIPDYSGTVGGYWSVAIRSDKAEEVGVTVTDLDSLGEYMAAIKAADPEAIPVRGAFGGFETLFKQEFGYGATPIDFFWVSPDGNGGLNYDDVVIKTETEEYLEYAKTIRAWAEAGYFEKNASSSTNDANASFENGTGYIAIHNLGALSTAVLNLWNNFPDAKAQIIDITPDATKWCAGYASMEAYAIGRNAENPERAMMLLDKFKNDREYHDLTLIGIEGVHYTNVEGDTELRYYVPTEDNGKFPVFGTAMWGWYNKLWARYATTALPEYVEMDTGFEAESKINLAKEFTFDSTEVDAEVAACTAILSQYGTIIDYGMSEDVEGTIAQMNTELYAAGLQDIYDAFTAQYTEFMAKLS